MGYDEKTLLAVALEEVGYLEKGSCTALEEKKANAGWGNYTKYARDLYDAGYYNGSKQGVSWCSVFVDWCHYIASGRNKALAQKISCQSGPYGAGCGYSMGYYKAAGRFFTADPCPGDQIYFGSGNVVEHTGLVVKKDATHVYTVEGNTSAESGVVSNGGGVFCKSYPLSHGRILGYGRPQFSVPQKDFSLGLNVLRKGNEGDQVRALQILLEGRGYLCGSWGADGKFGAATEKALLSCQQANDLQADGMAGPETWGFLLGA